MTSNLKRPYSSSLKFKHGHYTIVLTEQCDPSIHTCDLVLTYSTY